MPTLHLFRPYWWRICFSRVQKIFFQALRIKITCVFHIFHCLWALYIIKQAQGSFSMNTTCYDQSWSKLTLNKFKLCASALLISSYIIFFFFFFFFKFVWIMCFPFSNSVEKNPLISEYRNNLFLILLIIFVLPGKFEFVWEKLVIFFALLVSNFTFHWLYALTLSRYVILFWEAYLWVGTFLLVTYLIYLKVCFSTIFFFTKFPLPL